MAILDDVLLEEMERLQKMRAVMEIELASLPKGYLSHKKIQGRPYVYLQQRQGKKIISKYIPASRLEALQKQMERRNQLTASLKEIKQSLQKIERVRK